MTVKKGALHQRNECMHREIKIGEDWKSLWSDQLKVVDEFLAIASAGPAIECEGPAITITKASNPGSHITDARVVSRWRKIAIANKRS